MSKRYDIVDDSLEDKLRIGETILWIYGCLLVLAGVGFVIAECAVAEFGMAFVGLVATLSGAGLVALCTITFRMIRKVAALAHQMQRLTLRIDELELEFDANLHAMASHEDDDPDEVSDLEIQFAEAMASHDLATCRQLWPQVKRSTDPQRIRETEEQFIAFEKQTSTELRDAFAEQFRTADYHAALQTGERIVALFPESRMSADFIAIRSQIEAKANPIQTSPDDHPSVGNGHSNKQVDDG